MRYGKILRGLEILQLHGKISPQLVEPQELYDEVDELKSKVQAKEEMVLIAQPADLWECPASFVVTKELEVILMLHIPVAKRSSFKHLFRYEPTPLTAPGFDHHVLVYPRDPVLAIDRGSHISHPMTKEALDQCTRVGQGPKYCPGRKFAINQSKVGCLRALYGNDVPAVMTECPIVYMTPEYMHVAALSPHHFSVYTPKDILGRITCGEKYLGSQKLMAGLLEVEMSPKCKFTSEELELTPTIDLAIQEIHFDKITLDLAPLANLSEPVSWAVNNAKIATEKKNAGPSLADVSLNWDHTMLTEDAHWTFRTWASVILGIILGGIILLILLRCLIDIKYRRQDRGEMRGKMGEHAKDMVQEAFEELKSLLRNQERVPSAPAPGMELQQM